MTKAEMDEREKQEVKPETPKQVRSPKWLPEPLRKEFNSISRQLIDLGLMCKLDADMLGRYLIAQQNWLMASVRAQRALKAGDADGAKDWGAAEDRYFKQCRNAAGDMGLTISSRCRLVVPKGDADEDDSPILQLIERRNA